MRGTMKEAVPGRVSNLMCFGEGHEIGQIKWALWVMGRHECQAEECAVPFIFFCDTMSLIFIYVVVCRFSSFIFNIV